MIKYKLEKIDTALKALVYEQYKKGHTKLLLIWAVDCAERVIHLFIKKYPDDSRPVRALEVARAFLRDEATVGEARLAALNAHRAARQCDSIPSTAAARACGHAVATAHVGTHSQGAAIYALSAIAGLNEKRDEELINREKEWQLNRLLELVRIHKIEDNY